MFASPLAFAKLSGSGNDFILVDNRGGIVPEADGAMLARGLCHRTFSLGADGLILVENDPEYDFSWRFFNADGSVAAMCGNGSRCAARFAHAIGAAGETMMFRTGAGPIKARVEGTRVSVRLTPPRNLRLSLAVPLDGDVIELHAVDTGVPHVVVLVPDLEIVDVRGTGSVLRRHPFFAPAGTNVNFAVVTGPHSLALRTYERGVEGETQACGTGSVASAIVAAALGLVSPPVAVTVRSGEVLTVAFPPGEHPPADIDFEGEVRWIASGEASPEAWSWIAPQR